MAGRRKELQIVDPRDDVAKIVWEEWQKLNWDRMAWLNRGLEARKYVTAADTNATEVGTTLPWKNKTTIPKLTQLVDGLVSYYMAALMPADDWFVWEGDDEESHRKAKLIEKYMRTKIRMSGFRNELKKIVHDWVLYGNCFGGVSWVTEKTKSRVTKEEIVNYVGPKLYRISPLDCCIDPRSATFDISPYIERRLITIGDLIYHNEREAGPKYDPAIIKLIQETRADGPQKKDFIDFYTETGLLIDGFSDVQSYVNSGLVELITYWGDIYVKSTGECLKNRVITVADGAHVLRNEENPAWNGKKPFAHAAWRILPDNLYGQGPLDNIVGMQYRCDHLENLKADTFDQIVHPVVVIKGDSGEDYQWGPGAKWYVNADGGVDVLRPDASVLVADNQIALYHAYMDQIAGVPREMVGFRTPGEKTAFEVSTLQQGADRQFIDKISYFEDTFIEPMLNIMFELMIRNMDVTDIIRTFDKNTNAMELQEISKEDVVADGRLRPIGSKHYAARAKRMQELQTLLAMAQSPNIGLHISGRGAAKMLSEELGWDKWKVIEPFGQLKEQSIAQLYMNKLKELQGDMEPDEAEEMMSANEVE